MRPKLPLLICPGGGEHRNQLNEVPHVSYVWKEGDIIYYPVI
jgi:hypothetical protein